MLLSEIDFKKNIINTIKYARISNSLTQTDLSNVIGCSRFKIARIESGKSSISVEQLDTFMNFFHLSYDNLKLGIVDSKVSNDFENFEINKLHQRDAYTKGRSLYLYRQHFISLFGEDEFHQVCKDEKVDPLYFVNINNPLNINFNLRIIQKMRIEGHLNREEQYSLLSKLSMKLPAHHFKFFEEYRQLDGIEKVTKLIENMPFYEDDHKFEILKNDSKNESISYSFHPREHVDKSLYFEDPFIRGYYCQFNPNYFSNFSGINTTVQKHSCIFNGNECCSFTIKKERYGA
jgi:transcriptional regulator with XRE-family HTH domain